MQKNSNPFLCFLLLVLCKRCIPKKKLSYFTCGVLCFLYCLYLASFDKSRPLIEVMPKLWNQIPFWQNTPLDNDLQVLIDRTHRSNSFYYIKKTLNCLHLRDQIFHKTSILFGDMLVDLVNFILEYNQQYVYLVLRILTDRIFVKMEYEEQNLVWVN